MALKSSFAVLILSAGILVSGASAQAGTAMPTGAAVIPPGGFLGFCVRHLQECTGSGLAPLVVTLTAERRSQLDAVQASVNAAIRPWNDPQHVWDYPTNGYGDCNRYALEKRRELIEMGWPRQALLLTSAITETHEGHLVLVVRTSGGDLVLDNRLPPVVEWSRLPYQWVSRQSERSPAIWLAVGPAALTTADAGSGTPRIATP